MNGPSDCSLRNCPSPRLMGANLSGPSGPSGPGPSRPGPIGPGPSGPEARAQWLQFAELSFSQNDTYAHADVRTANTFFVI